MRILDPGIARLSDRGTASAVTHATFEGQRRDARDSAARGVVGLVVLHAAEGRRAASPPGNTGNARTAHPPKGGAAKLRGYSAGPPRHARRAAERFTVGL